MSTQATDEDNHKRYELRMVVEGIDGVCEICEEYVPPKRNGTKLEYYCKACSSARHFCKDLYCFHLVEMFYSECQFSHSRIKKMELVNIPVRRTHRRPQQ